MITRRRVILAFAAGALAAPLASFPQQQQRVYRIGILDPLSQIEVEANYNAFMQGLRELGYDEGKNILIERRFGEGHFDRLPALAADLVKQKVEVILAPNTVASRAARQATDTIPIVFSIVGDPVGIGLAASLARPGGNVTGISDVSADLSAKRLQLLKEVSPRSSRVAVFTSNEPQAIHQFAEVQRAAKFLHMMVLSVQVQNRSDFAENSALLRKWGADSMYVVSTVANFLNRRLLAEFVAMVRLPAIYPHSRYTEAGGLISYGANHPALFRRAAAYVDKILKGSKPAELPIEQPTVFELIVNMKTAKALGIKIPGSILVQATKVIE